MTANIALWAGLKQKGQDCQERVGIQFQERCFIKDKSGDKWLEKKKEAGKNRHMYEYKRSAYRRIVKNGEGFVGEQSAAGMSVNDDDVDWF